VRNFHQQSRLNSPANLSVSNNLPQLFFAGSRNSFLFIGLHTLCTNQRLYFRCNSINFCSLRTLVRTMTGWHLYRFSSERGWRAVETVSEPTACWSQVSCTAAAFGKRTVEPRYVAGASEEKPSGACASGWMSFVFQFFAMRRV